MSINGKEDNNKEWILKIVREELYFMADRMRDHFSNVLHDWHEGDESYSKGFWDGNEYVMDYTKNLTEEHIADTIEIVRYEELEKMNKKK